MRNRKGRMACWTSAVVIALCAGLAGCGSGDDKEPETSTQDQPVTVVAVQGTELHRVSLTEAAVRRLGIQTAPLQPKVIPLAAVLYDKDGNIWTYTSPTPLTFMRAPITLGKVNGDRAVLKSGPPAGTSVVTVGGAELLGAEYGVDGE
jgi:hypothetical protein